jgi:protease-4
MTGHTQRAARQARIVLFLLAGVALALALVVGLADLVERIADVSEFALSAVAVAAVLAAVAWGCGLLVRRVPQGTVLELDLTRPLTDDPLGRLAPRGRPTLRQVIEVLDRASNDPRIAGLVAWIRTPASGLATVQELRDAVASFRSKGKFAIAHAETFGEFAASNGAYYLATAFDEIWLQPSGDVGLVGLAMEVNFLRGTLDKLGVFPQFDHRYEYKNAKDLLTETTFTPAHREASEQIVSSLFEQLVDGIAEGRRLEAHQVHALVDSGPIFGSEAVEAGLVDRLAYRDEVVDHVKAQAGRLLGFPTYAKGMRGSRRRATRVALILGTGAIVQGRSRLNPLTQTAMGSDTITAAFRQAIKDKHIKAILFRIDSPGGSAVASDAIWRETVRVRQAGKPVVVSMGNVAGSGGYFVAMSADWIVAQPATITGSIGVIGGKTVVTDLKRKLGVSQDEVHAGANALISSTSTPYSDREWERLQRWLDRVYEDFTTKVAAGRDLPLERVHEVAKGRIWTGADALKIGLVDELGGYPSAVRALQDLLVLPLDAPMRLVPFPPRRSLLASLFGRDGHVEAVATGLGGVLSPLERLIHQATGEHTLEMPDVPTIR